MSLTAGTRIGAIEIVSLLGEGGMGAVYRARDTRLNRDVALKVLLPAVAGDPERLARFRREAQVLASLNHPHIGGIHGLEESDGTIALVMELVAGEDLSQRLARGAIPLDEALAIAKQIADALEAAHEQGIVHRDLKPANIKVRPDGTVKVLDFGLAKAMDPAAPASGEAMQAATITTPAMTQAGMILGTAAYMAPEQAKGKPVDKRADVWAFGCVLYEMLSGRGPFNGEGVTDTLARVIEREPDFTALPAATPPRLRELIARCLTKDPKQRLRDIGDARLVLDGAFDTGAETHMVVPPSRGGRRRILALVAAAAAAGLAGGLLLAAAWRPPTEGRQVLRAAIRLPADQRIVSTATDPFRVAIAPDGTRVAYVAAQGIYLRALASGEATLLPKTAGASGLFFSPDGAWLGYAQNDELFTQQLPGGTPRSLGRVPFFAGGSWGTDGAIVFASGAGGLFRVIATGGEPQRLMAADPAETTALPQRLPDSPWILYTAMDNRTGRFRAVAYSTETQERRVVGPRSGLYVPTGHFLSADESGVYLAPFDSRQAQTTGPDTALPFNAGEVVAGVSRSGHLVFTKMVPATGRQLVWVSRDGTATPLPFEPGPYRFPRLSPDQTRVALALSTAASAGWRATAGTDIWVYDLNGSSTTRLTFDRQNSAAVWSADGGRLAASGVDPSGSPRLTVQQANGAGQPVTIWQGPNPRFPYAWMDGDSRLLFAELKDAALDIGIIDTAAGGRERMVLASPWNETRPDVSPDGRWLAYTSNESGRDEVYVRPLPDITAGKWQVSTGGGHSPAWIPGGGELVFRAPGQMMSVAVRSGEAFSAGPPTSLFDDVYVNDIGGRSFDLARDGRLLMLRDEGSTTDQIEIIFNWFTEVERLMGEPRPR